MGRRVHFDFLGCILLAAALMVLPFSWLVAAILAAAFHELCHCLAARLLGIPIYGFIISSGGCELHTGPMVNWQELICAAAGPMGSLFLILSIRQFPKLALCGGMQGLYNLLPVYPLDGGRIARCGLSLLAGDHRAEMICPWVEIAVCVLCMSLGLWGTFALDLGLVPFICTLLLSLRLTKVKKTLQTAATQGTIDLTFTKR